MNDTVSIEALNAMPLAWIFPAIAPARVIAPGVSVGPVRTDEGEKFLVRFDGKVGQLARTEAEVLELAGPSIRRHVGRLDDARRCSVADVARHAAIAACPGHQIRAVEVGRALWRYVCDCGFAETVSSDG